jgi:phosphate:Na+ symporter
MYLESPFGSTPEIAIEAAARETDRMAGVTLTMLEDIRGVLASKDPIDPEAMAKVLKAEELTDVLEHKITEYLAALVHGHLSTASSHEALSLLSIINDLERIGDHGEKIVTLLKRLADGQSNFSDAANVDILRMCEHTAVVLTHMSKLILKRDAKALEPAIEREQALDAFRDEFRQQHLLRVQDRACDPLAGLIFTDLLTSFEKMGDHAFNVVQATLGHKVS